MFPAKVAALWGGFWVCAAWWVRLVPGGSLATSSHAVRSRAQAGPGRCTGLAGGVAGVGALGRRLPAGVATVPAAGAVGRMGAGWWLTRWGQALRNSHRAGAQWAGAWCR